MEKMIRAIRVFISYCYEDEPYRRDLEAHLRLRERRGMIHIWHAGHLTAGMHRNDETLKHLNEADVFLVLISPDYLNSEYNFEFELRRIEERHREEDVVVVPIILRPCAWQEATPLGNLRSLPSHDRPISLWRDRDAAFIDLIKELDKLFERLLAEPSEAVPGESPGNGSVRRVNGTPFLSTPVEALVGEEADEAFRNSFGASTSVQLGEEETEEEYVEGEEAEEDTSSIVGGEPGEKTEIPPAKELPLPLSPPLPSPLIKEAQPDAMKVTSDQAMRSLDEDQLGFGIWVRALHRFIISPETTTPLTVGIDGPWGTGKTSFMYMLQHELEQREQGRGTRWLFWFLLTYPIWLLGKLRVRFGSKYSVEISAGLSYDPEFDPPLDELPMRNPSVTARQLYWAKIAERHCPQTPRNNPTIWFDAWKFEQEQQLWSALALAVLDQIKKKYNWWYRLAFWFRLTFKRFVWPKALSTLLLRFLLPAALAVLAWQFNLLIQVATQAYPSSLGTLLTIQPLAQGLLGFGAFISGLVLVKDIVSNPFRIPVRQIFDRPNYEEKVGFINDFEDDFANIVAVMTRPRLGWKARKLVIFIDDLDRCKPPKSVDIIEAINLFLGSKQCVFVIGVDTSTVVASVETKYKDLFERMHVSRAKVVSEGRFFLEKIIQVPLHVPPVTEDGITRLIEHITAQGFRPLQGANSSTSASGTSSASSRRRGPLNPLSEPDLSASYSRQEVREAIRVGAQLVRDNPRQVKRFVNLFRLSIYVLNAQELFEVRNDSGLTLDRLAVWVAWSVRWGELARYLAEEMSFRHEKSGLLDLLGEIALRVGNDWDWLVSSDVPSDLSLLHMISQCRSLDGHGPTHWCRFPWELWLGELNFRRCVKELEMLWLPPSSDIDWLRTLLLTTRVTLPSPLMAANNAHSAPS